MPKKRLLCSQGERNKERRKGDFAEELLGNRGKEL